MMKNIKKIMALCVVCLTVCGLCLALALTVGATPATVSHQGEVQWCFSAVDEVGALLDKEPDMGGPFSGPRLELAGQMILIGMGMIFAVLAVLWGILILFKKILHDGPAKKAAKAAKEAQAVADVTPQESSAPAPIATEPQTATSAIPGTEDGAIVAAITAAIAATIASDATLASQFADGFRVVSFKKKTDRSVSGARWNH